MRLAAAAHTARPWRIHALTPDFRVEDVWALPTPGGRDDFPRLVAGMASGEVGRGAPRVVRALFALRWAPGRLFGWDRPADGGRGGPSLRDRLPADLRATPAPARRSAGFTALYQLPDEWAGELANRTMHGVMHLGLGTRREWWLPRPDGGPGPARGLPGRGLHGRDTAVSPSRRVPGPAADDRAALAGGRGRGAAMSSRPCQGLHRRI